jgi:hypothetical protein
MDNDILQAIALALGVGLGGGFNIYATMLMVGISGATGSVDLPNGLDFLQNPLVIAAAGGMYFIEFFADKIPGFDSLWDSLHTFIRIPLGAMLTGDAVADYGVIAESIGMAAGAGLSSATHFTKSGTRALINTSPEPVTNWTASVSEDVAVFTGVWAAINHPIIWTVIAIITILILVWILPKIWRGIKLVFKKIVTLFGKKEPQTS